MRCDTQVWSSDAFMVDTLWARARRLLHEQHPSADARLWPSLKLETRIMFFERAAESMGVPLR